LYVLFFQIVFLFEAQLQGFMGNQNGCKSRFLVLVLKCLRLFKDSLNVWFEG